MHQRGKADGRDLPGNLGNANRPAKLIGGFATDDNTADIAQRAIDHEPDFLGAKRNSAERRNWLVFDVAGRHRAADAENPDAMDVAEIILDLLKRGGRLEHERGAVTVDLDVERPAGAVAHDPL